ncbi:hypothetical protein [Streptomyces sp. WELS2]|uniref:hypothetical protein n=1 Tax=Streptomyces sp. WELS2 TaxID=2749435 RepID=UPI0015F074FD|nr:hypothetical protein [Streptomyces sp. WELS2]
MALGASIGDHPSQPEADGGVGTVVTGVLFLAVVLGRVVYPTVTSGDVAEPESAARPAAWTGAKGVQAAFRRHLTESNASAGPHASAEVTGRPPR